MTVRVVDKSHLGAFLVKSLFFQILFCWIYQMGPEYWKKILKKYWKKKPIAHEIGALDTWFDKSQGLIFNSGLMPR